ncbi:hypothetical protein IKW75_02560 [Candidatus Saccharibacteria bacterium]|nr:hypothetical protein [Candidatus Saccharibacteria bacterium]
MFAVDLVRWWYAKGWRVFFDEVKTKVKDTADAFSIGELLQTLFKPYRRLGTENRVGDTKLNIFLDKLVSRVVGTLSRTVLIVTGVIFIIIETIVGGVLVAIWPLVPLLPVAGVILAVLGVKL